MRGRLADGTEAGKGSRLVGRGLGFVDAGEGTGNEVGVGVCSGEAGVGGLDFGWNGMGRVFAGCALTMGTSSSLSSASCLMGDPIVDAEPAASGVAAAKTGTVINAYTKGGRENNTHEN